MKRNNKQLTDYIAACNSYDAEQGYQLDDAAMAEHVAYIFVAPRRFFFMWLRCVFHKFR